MSYSADPTLYLYTSLTSGSSHIVTATSRLETILKANKIPFKAIDLATDEKARMIWGRRAGKDDSGRVRKIPGLVQMGMVIGDLVEIEDWNEYGELKQHVTLGQAPGSSSVATPPNLSKAPEQKETVKPETVSSSSNTKEAEETKPLAGAAPTSLAQAMKQAGEEAANKAKDLKKKVGETVDGVGGKEPENTDAVKDNAAKTVAPPAAVSVTEKFESLSLDEKSTLQSPTSTAWRSSSLSFVKTEREVKVEGERHSIDKLESLQSPNSTAWKPTDSNPTILTHRGSSVSQASAEEIMRIEDQEAIPEEDEDE